MQNKQFITITVSVLTRSLNAGRIGWLTPPELPYLSGNKTAKEHALDKAKCSDNVPPRKQSALSRADKT
jgi:hypothetical protein